MSMLDYISKMRKRNPLPLKDCDPPPVKEALRTPSVKTATVQVVSYAAATTTGEEIARRFKTTMLPQIANLCGETETFYNMYSTSHDDEEGKSKQVKELKPVEDLYNALMKAQDVILNFIAKRKKEAANESIEAAGASEMDSMDDAGDTSGIERLIAVMKEIAARDDAAAILEGLEDADGIADELESAMNTYESHLTQSAEKKDY